MYKDLLMIIIFQDLNTFLYRYSFILNQDVG